MKFTHLLDKRSDIERRKKKTENYSPFPINSGFLKVCGLCCTMYEMSEIISKTADVNIWLSVYINCFLNEMGKVMFEDCFAVSQM